MHPLVTLLIGIVTIIGLIVVFRVHAFIALIVSALVVSFLAPGDVAQMVPRVAMEFGAAAGKIGIVIALASVIGVCMMESGAADRIVRAFLRLLGEPRAPVALTGSGYVLAMPVFFDTVFYLLVPLARSLYRRTGKNYLLSLLAIVAGGAITHTLVPPTPGPLVMAAQLQVDLGVMILAGMVVALPTAAVGLLFSAYVNRRMPLPMREVPGLPTTEPLPDDQLPPLGLSLLPVLLPVLLITLQTVVAAMAENDPTIKDNYLPYAKLVGDANLALLLSAAMAVSLYVRQRRPSKERIAHLIETSLMSGGVIILITAAGGAFGAMLKAAEIGPAVEQLFAGTQASGLMYLGLGFGISVVLKVAQGSSTVAMITASSMLAAMLQVGIEPPAVIADKLGYHMVYLALAIGAGSLVGSWMNDSGFWIFVKMGGLTEVEGLKTWTPLLAVLGSTAMIITVIFALIIPLRQL
ncbi:MAG: SLC13 family permease [Gemmataceae bacterium]|nr:GntP family permease [Gemmata sp.]MDW8198107.1 SLC13 family permease [Gemmataceae bacterium]